MDDRTSKVPAFSYPTDETAQWAALAENPLLARMLEARRAFDDRYRPIYHYVNPEARLNDPNGLCFWRGRWHWHLFYQAYPPEDTRQHWGHAVSDDLVHWQDLPYCIYPDPEDRCFSGTTWVEDDRVIAMYHGTELGNMVAVSDDPLLLNWTKLGDGAVIPIVESDRFLPKAAPYRVFDPCIWHDGERYYSLSAGQLPTGPGGAPVAADFLFASDDLVDWEYLHPFIEDDRFSLLGDDGACPYFLPIGDRHILLYYSHMSGGAYLIGDYDRGAQKFRVTFGGNFNHGPSGPGGVHAPSATALGDSVVTIFNMNPSKPTPGWNQIMSLPRVLDVDERGELRQRPIDSATSLRRERLGGGAMDVPANRTTVLEGVASDAIEIDMRIAPSDAQAFEIHVLRSPGAGDDVETTRIVLLRNRGYRDHVRFERGQDSLVSIDNSRSSIAADVESRAPETARVFIDPTSDVELRIFVDKSIVEVFVDDRTCIALRVYPERDDSRLVAFRSQGSETRIRSLDVYAMEDIYATD